MSALVELPIELLERIFEYFQDITLIGMRKVCKRTKEFAEATALNRRSRAGVHRLAIHPKRKNDFEDIIVQFLFKDTMRAKLIVLCALKYLNIEKFECSSQEINNEMPFADLGSFFTKLAPLTCGIDYNVLHIFPSCVETFAIISKFLNGKSVDSTTLVLRERENFRAVIQFVQQLRPTNLRAFAVSSPTPNWLSNERFGSLLRTNPADIFTFARKVLETRCSYLDLSDACLDVVFTDDEVNCQRAVLALAPLQPGKVFYFVSGSFAYSAGFSEADKCFINAFFGKPRTVYW